MSWRTARRWTGAWVSAGTDDSPTMAELARNRIRACTETHTDFQRTYAAVPCGLTSDHRFLWVGGGSLCDRLDESGFNGPAHNLSAVGRSQLREDVGDVGFDGALAHHQFGCNLPIRLALRDEGGNFALPRRQLIQFFSGSRVLLPLRVADSVRTLLPAQGSMRALPPAPPGTLPRSSWHG